MIKITLHRSASKNRGEMIGLFSELQKRPSQHAVGSLESHVILRLLQSRIGLCCRRVNVGIALTGKEPVQVLRLCKECCRDRRLLRPLRSKEDAGHHSELRVDRADHLKAGVLPCLCIITAEHIFLLYLRRINLLSCDRKRRDTGSVCGPQKRDLDRSRRIQSSDIVRPSNKRCSSRCCRFHHQRRKQKPFVLDRCRLLRSRDTCVREILHVLLRVQNVDEHKRSHVEDAERGIHHLAKCEAFEIIGISEFLRCLLEGRHKDRSIRDLFRILCHIDRSGPHHNTEPGICRDRDA